MLAASVELGSGAVRAWNEENESSDAAQDVMWDGSDVDDGDDDDDDEDTGDGSGGEEDAVGEQNAERGIGEQRRHRMVAGRNHGSPSLVSKKDAYRKTNSKVSSASSGRAKITTDKATRTSDANGAMRSPTSVVDGASGAVEIDVRQLLRELSDVRRELDAKRKQVKSCIRTNDKLHVKQRQQLRDGAVGGMTDLGRKVWWFSGYRSQI